MRARLPCAQTDPKTRRPSAASPAFRCLEKSRLGRATQRAEALVRVYVAGGAVCSWPPGWAPLVRWPRACKAGPAARPPTPWSVLARRRPTKPPTQPARRARLAGSVSAPGFLSHPPRPPHHSSPTTTHHAPRTPRSLAPLPQSITDILSTFQPLLHSL